MCIRDRFYAASAPGKAPFAPVGKKVSKGSTVCIIEAMKCMNEIQAEDDYEIVGKEIYRYCKLMVV